MSLRPYSAEVHQKIPPETRHFEDLVPTINLRARCFCMDARFKTQQKARQWLLGKKIKDITAMSHDEREQLKFISKHCCDDRSKRQWENSWKRFNYRDEPAARRAETVDQMQWGLDWELLGLGHAEGRKRAEDAQGKERMTVWEYKRRKFWQPDSSEHFSERRLGWRVAAIDTGTKVEDVLRPGVPQPKPPKPPLKAPSEETPRGPTKDDLKESRKVFDEKKYEVNRLKTDAQRLEEAAHKLDKERSKLKHENDKLESTIRKQEKQFKKDHPEPPLTKVAKRDQIAQIPQVETPMRPYASSKLHASNPAIKQPLNYQFTTDYPQNIINNQETNSPRSPPFKPSSKPLPHHNAISSRLAISNLAAAAAAAAPPQEILTTTHPDLGSQDFTHQGQNNGSAIGKTPLAIFSLAILVVLISCLKSVLRRRFSRRSWRHGRGDVEREVGITLQSLSGRMESDDVDDEEEDEEEEDEEEEGIAEQMVVV